MPLRPYQVEALENIKNKLRSGVNRQVVSLCTGGGKTVIFANVPQMLGGKYFVLVHREELAKQAHDKISKWNPTYKVGIEMADNYADLDCDIVVGSVQTMARENRQQRFDLKSYDGLIVDEVHHYISPQFKSVIDAFGIQKGSNRLLLGVSATPNRSDGAGLDSIADEIVYEMGMYQAVKEGWLSEPRGLRITTDINLDGVKTTAGDLNQKQLETAVNTPARNRLIVEKWLEKASDRRTIGFSVDIAHAKDLAAEFKRQGVKAEAVWGTDPDRADKVAAHSAGEFMVLTNAQVLTEGYDDPGVRCILLAKPTKSKLLYCQMVGRGTRLQASVDNLLEARKLGQKLEKEDCLIIDVVDNTTKHSLVTVPSLMGLNPDLDLKGESVVFAKDRVDALQAANPLADMSLVTDIDQLRGETIPVDLWKVDFAPEILKETRLQWHKTGENSYLLSMKGGQGAVVWQDSLNKWHLKAAYGQNSFNETFDTRKGTFGFAERMLNLCCGDDARWLTRNNSWGQKPASKNQIDYLRRRGITTPEDITTGQANKIINRLQAMQSVGAAQ